MGPQPDVPGCPLEKLDLTEREGRRGPGDELSPVGVLRDGVISVVSHFESNTVECLPVRTDWRLRFQSLPLFVGSRGGGLNQIAGVEPLH